ncbi:DEAD/DEAH box helicase [Synechocystis sp. FACHB-383]|uniref:DEAD/DEAH box helicase n=1 Tax=Synechocystis sp. FACHB-383 TaxID=2692864 RepID=UPI0016842DD5|nr:DEAD/DEAH box helicase [Synechocystis sp. FACHB-383]MBD2654237.1 DEAD/DEAH box helicase [Synechocystis sp. FACHB-383]
MATIHGNWQPSHGENGGRLFLWADTWGTTLPETTGDRHPFALDVPALVQAWSNVPLAFPPADKVTEQTLTLHLPSHCQQKIPLPFVTGQDPVAMDAKYLHWRSWQITGMSLTPKQTLTLLQSIPLGGQVLTSLGSEFYFYGQLHRWCLDLVLRGKFVPGLGQMGQDGGYYAQWIPILDSIQDQTYLAQFTQRVPPCALALTPETEAAQGVVVDLLQQLVQAQIEVTSPAISNAKEAWLNGWLKGLTQPEQTSLGTGKALQRLATTLDHWYLPVQGYLGQQSNQALAQRQWRGSLRLQPPVDGAGGIWQLEYGLQALDDGKFWLPAAALWAMTGDRLVWQGRRVEQGAESLLRGLGVAAQIYEPIADSLAQRCPTGCELDAIQAYEFILAIGHQLRDRGLGVILPAGLERGGTAKRLGVKVVGEVQRQKGQRLTLQSLINYDLQLMMGTGDNARLLTNADFEGLLAQKSPLVVLDGEWITLQPADVRAAKAILQQQQSAPPLTVEDALRLSIGDLQTVSKLPVTQFAARGMLQELIDTLRNPQGVEPIATPPGFQGTLRPYQARGVGWLAFLERWGLGACLADDMGLGKTPQLLAFLLHLAAEDMLVKPVLIVCPTSVMSNWQHEINKFAPQLNTVLHHGDRRKKGQPLVKQVKDQQIVLTSYALLQRDFSSLKLVDWQGVVLDEAQNIKNPQAKQSQAARQLPAGFRIALTGTPVENRLTELWSILEFLNPGFLGTQSFFQRRFANPIEKFGDRQSLLILRNLVRPFILRRLKTDQTIIQDLPEKQEMTVFCDLSQQQANLYQQLVEESLTAIANSEGIQRHGLVLTLLTKLKQVCNHPDLLLKKPAITHGHHSGKLIRLAEMLEEMISEGDRALIFTQFASWGHLLKPYLEKHFNQEVLYLHGGTPAAQRQALVERFQHDPHSPHLFILSLKAGGTGLNLTRANHVFHVDRWWNPAVENQATDRAFRIGQTRNVQVHKFVCTGTLEEKINAMMADKQQLAEQTVDAGENWLTRLDTDKLRQLLTLSATPVDYQAETSD